MSEKILNIQLTTQNLEDNTVKQQWWESVEGLVKYLTDTGLYTEIILTKKFNTADTVLKRMTDK